MTFLVQQTLIYAVPLMIVALAGVFAERSGIINLALEGIMIFGAFIGVLFVRLMQGSGLMKYWGISEEKRKTMPKMEDLKCVEIENPMVPGQKVVAVPVPRIDTALIHVQQASPDGTCIICGDEFHDIDIAVAARKVIAADDAVDFDFNAIKHTLAQEIAADPAKVDAALDLLMVIKYLERIGDHAVNVAEWVQFVRTGRYKDESMF